MVDVGNERALLPIVHLAWTSGREAEPEVWKRQPLFREAPNGVLRSELRQDVPHGRVRILPVVGDRPPVDDTGGGR